MNGGISSIRCRPRAREALANRRRHGFSCVLLCSLLAPWLCGAQLDAEVSHAVPPPMILTVEGTNVWVRKSLTNVWTSAFPNQTLAAKDRGRTGRDSRTSVRLSDLSVMRIGPHSEFEIQPLPDPSTEAEFSLWRGLMRLLNRDRPGKHRFVTPTATAATRGTEFVLEVEEVTGRTTLTVFEGEAELQNALGSIRIASGEQGIAVAGQAPTKTAVIDARAVVQWCLYYPGILDVNELDLTADETSALANSLDLYERGDLLRALAAYPPGRVPVSDQDRVYLAALQLAAGQVREAEALLNSLDEGDTSSRMQRLSQALRLVVDVVNQRKTPSAPATPHTTPLATELLALSYYHQSRYQLADALASAERSTSISPDFALAWARVAELEFSHGRLKPARRSLDRSLESAPRNAQAIALRGFLLAAQNRIPEAMAAFDEAITIDGALGNAWLGRGLCRIRRGDPAGGRFDLQVAAALEPQRSILRSYLGKAFSNAGDSQHAEQELDIAKQLDSQDPTPWLYSALLLREGNQINDAVTDLERSQELNDNRRVYRSRLLLDQDRAVRSANLANVYQDADMFDVSLREAGRAVNADYANYSAHLFLANSYDELRDPNQINLRYENAWLSEYMLANLLAPVGAGTLSQGVSQQEYSKLFERDRFGFTSSTEYFSHGEWIQNLAQYGIHRKSSYAVDFSYRSDDGYRPNTDIEQLGAAVSFKHHMTPHDSVFLRAAYFNAETGDVFPRYSEADVNLGLRTEERVQPWVLAGYHHEWQPGHHTLALVGWLDSRFLVDNPTHTVPLFNRGSGGPILEAASVVSEQAYRSDLNLISGEIQDIRQIGQHTLILGGLAQSGDFDVMNQQEDFVLFDGTPVTLDVDQDISSESLRLSAYAYDQWQFHSNWQLTVGVSYDWMQFPANHRFAPITSREDTRDQVSPKAGLIWIPAPKTTVRGAYSRGLGGVSLDQSVRLEPTQVAGFNQAFRSIIPEAVAGANAVPTLEMGALSVEQRVGERTFAAVAGKVLSSDVDRAVGVVDFTVSPVLGPGFSAGTTRQELEFSEQTLTVALNQLLGEQWAFGAAYRVSHAELDQVFTEVPLSATSLGGFQREQNLEATLHQVHLSALYNHRSGFFARVGAVWNLQRNRGYTPDLPGDEFWQLNAELGYRFARRRAEIRIGLLNLTDQDYMLNPLNLTPELPREREVAVRFQLNF